MSRQLFYVHIFTFLIFVSSMSIESVGEMKSKTECCTYWRSKVDDEVKQPESMQDVNEADPQVILDGIECLLKMEGNKHPAKFSGAVNDDVSQLFPKATADVAALYYISYLFFQKWDHADAIALRGTDGEINTSEDIQAAYKSYKKWFEAVKKVGIVKAREMKLEPLKDTKVKWY
jgi:hypothetical protein